MKASVAAVLLLLFSHTSFAEDSMLDKVLESSDCVNKRAQFSLMELRGMVRETNAIVSYLNRVLSGEYPMPDRMNGISVRLRSIARQYRTHDQAWMSVIKKDCEPAESLRLLEELAASPRGGFDYVALEMIRAYNRELESLDRLIMREREELRLATEAGELASEKIAVRIGR